MLKICVLNFKNCNCVISNESQTVKIDVFEKWSLIDSTEEIYFFNLLDLKNQVLNVQIQ